MPQTTAQDSVFKELENPLHKFTAQMITTVLKSLLECKIITKSQFHTLSPKCRMQQQTILHSSKTSQIVRFLANIPTDEGINCVTRAFRENPNPRRPDVSLLTLLKLMRQLPADRWENSLLPAAATSSWVQCVQHLKVHFPGGERQMPV
jgi:hypothetical protein